MFQHLVNFYPICAQSVQFKWLNVSWPCCLKCRAVLCSLLVATWGLGIWIFWNSVEEADVDSSVSQVYAVPLHCCFPETWASGSTPNFWGAWEEGHAPTSFVYNLLILESRLWNLRDVLRFVWSSCEVTGQGVLDAKKGSHPNTAALSWWGQAGEQHWWGLERYQCASGHTLKSSCY